MKKFFTLVAMATMALAANAQYVAFDTNGLNADALTDVAAETVMGVDATTGITAKTTFADQCKIVGVTASKFSVMTIGSTEIDLSGGYQGNNNPKDKDGGNPASTLLPAASGSVLLIEVPSTFEGGYIYVIGKFSQNKQYVVTEDNAFIGYTIVCDGTAAGQAKALVAEVKGDDAEGYFVTTPIDALGVLNGAGSSAANNGVGFIKFQAWGGSSYKVHAAGSKLTQVGMFISATGDETITISGTGEEAPTPIQLQPYETAVQGIAEAKAEAKAPVKVITANGVQIGNYNVAGQQVK